MPSTSTQGTTAAPAPDNVAREALKFVLSPSGTFFRDFLMTELVQSFDALSRKQVSLCETVFDSDRSTIIYSWKSQAWLEQSPVWN